MTLKERHQHKSEVDLLTIIESPESYTQECRLVVKKILDERDIPEEEINKMIFEVNIAIATNNLDKLNPLNDDIKIHKSQFLSEEQIRKIYLSQMEELLEKKEGFRFDVWKYAIGGI